MVQKDDDIFLCVGDWSGGYDTEIVSDSDDEVESWGEWLIEGGRIVLVIAWIFGVYAVLVWEHKY